MSQRKLWRAQEDNALKYLYQQRGIRKWSTISNLMQSQFDIFGRNGKQCRQRYHNHLDVTINKSEWKKEEQDILFNIHNQLGNRWAEIARRIPGRTDNCVKNHLYSKLRKAIRQINKYIFLYRKKQFKEIKIAFIYKLIENVEQKYKQFPLNPSQVYQECYELKNKLIKCSYFEVEDIENDNQVNKQVRNIIIRIIKFNKTNTKKNSKIKAGIPTKQQKKQGVQKQEVSQSSDKQSQIIKEQQEDYATKKKKDSWQSYCQLIKMQQPSLVNHDQCVQKAYNSNMNIQKNENIKKQVDDSMIYVNTENLNSKILENRNEQIVNNYIPDEEHENNDKLLISLEMPAFTQYNFSPANFIMIETPIRDYSENGQLIQKWTNHDFMNK